MRSFLQKFCLQAGLSNKVTIESTVVCTNRLEWCNICPWIHCIWDSFWTFAWKFHFEWRQDETDTRTKGPKGPPKRVILSFRVVLMPPSWRHAHAHFGFAHRQQPLRWLKPFLKHWYVKLYELIAPHTLKWINSVIKLGHFVWNVIYCLSRIKFKDRWVVFFIYDSFCWTKSPTAASLGSRNDAM